MNIIQQLWGHVTHRTNQLDEVAAKIIFDSLSIEQRNTLKQLFTDGPVQEGQEVSRYTRIELIDAGLCTYVYYKGEDVYIAATNLGGRVIKYGGGDNE